MVSKSVMEADLVIDKLAALLNLKSGDIVVDAKQLKIVLNRVNSLELALADVLRLLHARKVAA